MPANILVSVFMSNIGGNALILNNFMFYKSIRKLDYAYTTKYFKQAKKKRHIGFWFCYVHD